MRGEDVQTAALFSHVSCEARVPSDHPLRLIRAVVDEALGALSAEFERLCARVGRPSIPPPQTDRRGARLDQAECGAAPDQAPRHRACRMELHACRRRLQPGAIARAPAPGDMNKAGSGTAPPQPASHPTYQINA